MKIVEITQKVRFAWINQMWYLYLEGTEKILTPEYIKSMVWDWYPIEGINPSDLYVFNQDGIILKMVASPSPAGAIDRTITLRNGESRDIKGAWSSNSYTLLSVTGIVSYDTSYNLSVIDISEGALKGLIDKFGFSFENGEYTFDKESNNCTPHPKYKDQYILTPLN